MFKTDILDLQTKFNLLLKEYNLTDIVACLNEYLETQLQIAQVDSPEQAEILYNASGFSVMLLSELERLPVRSNLSLLSKILPHT